MTEILAIYDIVGIQEYIFSSKKLKENIGASNIVQKVFSSFLTNINLIYFGGGNALVLFPSKEIAIATTEQLSKKVMEETDGILKFVVAYKNKTDNFSSNMKDLMIELQKKKDSTIHTYPVSGISITREASTDRLPAFSYEDKDYISYSANKKRESSNEDIFSNLKHKKDTKFPLEFDQLGQVEGNSYISVVHIDGNAMGNYLSKLINSQSNYETAITDIKSFSEYISTSYFDTMKDTINYLSKNLTKLSENSFNIKDNILPIRVIVLNGDDITFVCDGRLGLPLAEYFLKKLTEYNLDDENPLYACAGVCIVKTAFPFYRAYKYAEELCNTAKQMARIDNQDVNSYHSWIDWQVIRSGIYTSISELREAEYNIPAFDQAIESSGRIEGENLTLKKYNLLLRPYKINDSNSELDFEKILKVKNELKNGENKIPRNKLKGLRNSLVKSKEEVEVMESLLKSRGVKIPEFNYDTALFPNNIFPYFDAMELIEFYQDLTEGN